MDYELTQHAQDSLLKRRIKLEWIKRVLISPQWTEPDPVDPDLIHRMAPIEESGGRILRVIVNVNREPQRVVTAFFDTRRKHR